MRWDFLRFAVVGGAAGENRAALRLSRVAGDSDGGGTGAFGVAALLAMLAATALESLSAADLRGFREL